MAVADATLLTPISLSDFTAVSVATLASADGTEGNKFVANQGTVLRVKNASGSQITVTVHTNYTRAGLALADDTFVVAATTGDVAYRFASPIETFHADLTNRYAWIEFSAATSVTVQVIQP